MKLTKNINKNIFREYDIRGVYGVDLNEDVAYTLGKSFGSYIKKMGVTETIIGHDNRLSSPILSNALIKGILETGINVVNLGLVTTPMYYYARKFYSMKTGIMITASHNPKDDNGFKMAFDEVANAYGPLIKKFMDFTFEQNFSDGIGFEIKRDIKEDYLKLLSKSVNMGKKKIRAVLDCGNGTGSIIIKDIFDMFGIPYYPLYCDSDGNFPNHHPDPSVSKNMKDLSEKVKELGYDIGIGIDGDADRVGIVDEQGNIIPADLYMLIVCRYIAPKMKNKKLMFDVKCSKTLIDELEKLNIEPVMYRTGNSYTCRMMQEGDFDFGGEYSGHIYFRDKFPGIDDGIYAGLRMIEILSNTDKKLSELLDGINKYYATEEIKVAVPDEKKFSIIEKIKDYAKKKEYNIVDIDGVRVNFVDGWALVRASNTGPNITMRFEANKKGRLKEIQKEFTNIVNDIIKD